jgi:hypothetical protein
MEFRNMMKSMEPQKEQIAPEILQAIIAKATASGLSVNDYLARLLELTNGTAEDAGGQTLTPYELVEDVIGSIDSSVPDPDPDAQPRRTVLGQLVAENLRKQGLKIP